MASDAAPSPASGSAPAGASASPEPARQAASAEALLRRLEWTVLRRLDGLLQGDYRTLMRGSGIDLADLREYQLHDDVRHIDWNVTARMAQPHVRVFTEDRETSAWLLLDLTASVDFGSNERTKRQVASEFAALLARVLTRHGNRVGALLYGSQADTLIPAGTSRMHVLQLLHRMLTPSVQPAAAPGKSGAQAATATRLHELLHAAGHAIRRRSAVFVVSDFISEPGWHRPLAQLAQRHDVVAVRVLDPLEQELPEIGMLTLRDAETGETLLIDTHDKRFRQRFAQLAAEREAALREELARAGVDTLELRTDDDLLDALLRFADLRKRRVSGRGITQVLRKSA